MRNSPEPLPGGPVWVHFRGEWRPGVWLRTVERGRRAGHAVVQLGYNKRKRTVPADAIVGRCAP